MPFTSLHRVSGAASAPEGQEASGEGNLHEKEVGEFGMGEWKGVPWHCHHLVQAGSGRGRDVRLKGGQVGMGAAP